MIIPALDISQGQIVRLKQGDFQRKTFFKYNLISKIKSYENQGAKLIHIVDLDGAKNPIKRQKSCLKKILNCTNIPIEIGGGIRSFEDIKQLLELGVSMVVIGSIAIKKPQLVRGWVKYFGADKITIAADVRVIDNIPYVATNGWLDTSQISLHQIIKDYQSVGAKHFLITDISKDGMMMGANNDLYLNIQNSFNDLHVIASGGISSLEDIKKVKNTGTQSLVLGKSLLTEQFTLKEAIACWQNA